MIRSIVEFLGKITDPNAIETIKMESKDELKCKFS